MQTLARNIFRLGMRILKWLLYATLLYGGIVVIGLVPVNNKFTPEKDGVQIYVASNAVHADIIVPKLTTVANWSEEFEDASFAGNISDETHVAFGWGDRGFFLETETWEDLKLSTAVNALLLPSTSCVHVSFTRPSYHPDAVAVTISQEQYRELVVFFRRTISTNPDGDFEQIDGYAYSTTDAFFNATGRYHLLNTCNSWVGRGLRVAGVRVPWFSPMPKSPTLYID